MADSEEDWNVLCFIGSPWRCETFGLAVTQKSILSILALKFITHSQTEPQILRTDVKTVKGRKHELIELSYTVKSIFMADHFGARGPNLAHA